ncbi:MAG: glycosyltransferase [Verrucomicrobiota bacterium]|nr:glycosyltransferase [Verrucomicrobiota bacterium]
MSKAPLVSIVIDSYNYARFLPEAIDSALNQNYPRTEVVVVDDGSTDHSAEVIAGYGDRIVPVLQENRGQAAAFNTGFRRSRGEVILILDSDDALFPTAAASAVEVFRDPQVIKAHWPLYVIDEEGHRTGKMCPRLSLTEGDLRNEVLAGGPWCVATPPTSCNAWTRRFLERIMPVPEAPYRICADSYLITLGWVSGRTRLVREPQGLYRVHGKNNYAGQPFFQKLRRDMEVYELLCGLLSDFFSRQGAAIKPENWKRQSWPHRLALSAQEIAAAIPAGETFILLDDDNWGGQICERLRQLPFLEKEGQYWGPPPDDETALRELERMRKEHGANFMVFGWPAFWWLEHYRKFAEYVRTHFRCLLQNERLVVFDLRTSLP